MTVALSGEQIAAQIKAQVPDSIVSAGGNVVEVKPEALLAAATYLKTAPDLAFDYLTAITAVDYQEYIEVIYQLVSIEHNHGLLLKTRLYDRQAPVLSSVVGLWRGADFQEREIFDLFGIKFDGHPNLKHLVLWEGFPGHPLRKDYLQW